MPNQSSRPAGPSLSSLPLPGWAYAACLALLLIALTAAGALAYQHLTGNALPGCSAGGGAPGTSTSVASAAAPVSACASLDAHPMGSLGGMVQSLTSIAQGNPVGKVAPAKAWWPMSFVGATYYAAALGAWVVVGLRGRQVGRIVRLLAWSGVGISLVYLAVIVISQKFCQYCITSHVANLAFVGLMEIGMRSSARRVRLEASESSGSSESQAAGSMGESARRGSERGWPAVLAGAAVFLMSSGALGVLESGRREAEAAKSSAAINSTMSEMQRKIEQEKAAEAAKPKDPWGTTGFTGRWLLGPQKAQVRIVMLSSYQCPDCKIIEAEAMGLVEKYKDKVSLAAMHWPMCTDCNKYVSGANPHPNGCWAARAAEAAGMIRGQDGFWAMHKWLFEKNGRFETEDQLKAGLKTLNYSEDEQKSFLALMQGKLTEDKVKGDIEIGENLGLYYTPMIFVNGVELREWLGQPMALTKLVEQTLALNPPVAGPENDRPVLAREKYVEDWRKEKTTPLPPARPERTRGKADAKVVITVFGDFTEPNTAKVDELVRSFLDKKDIRYVFRHFPGAKECNSRLPKDFFPNGCLAARAAEAAGIVGGPDAYWKMHVWLLKNNAGLTQQRVTNAAATLGLDEAKFADALKTVDAAIAADVQVAVNAGVNTIPAIYVGDASGGKLVRRWTRENDNVLERIIDELLTGKPQ